MYKNLGHILELAGVASCILGVIFAAHYLKIEVPIVAGVAAIYVGRYLSK
jgi:hypothetical protein